MSLLMHGSPSDSTGPTRCAPCRAQVGLIIQRLARGKPCDIVCAMTTTPTDVSFNAQREPLSHYIFTSVAGTAVVNSGTPGEWTNLTQLVSLQPLTAEIGARLDATASDEAIFSQFTGPYEVEVSATMSGGTATNDLFLGLLVDSNGVFPAAAATVPIDRQDISEPLVAAAFKHNLHIRFILESAAEVMPNIASSLGTKFQVVSASDLASESITWHRLSIKVHRLSTSRGTPA